MIELTQHPLSAAFPAMSADDFQSLKDSIENIGVQNPITLYEGLILDGWHRYCAANDVGLPCQTVELADDTDPRDFVLAQNRSRRHITQAQLAMATTSVFAWRPEGRPKLDTECPVSKTTAELSKIAGVHANTIKQAKVVKTSAVPEVVEAVKSGAIGLPKAAAISKLPKEQQAAAIDKPMASSGNSSTSKAAPSGNVATPDGETAGNVTTQPAKAAAKEAAAQVAEDAYGDSDPIAMLEDAEKQNEALQKQLNVLLQEDAKAELHKMMLLRDHAVRRQNELMGMVNVREKELQRMSNWLRRIGAAVGEAVPAKIAAKVEATVREQKVDA